MNQPTEDRIKRLEEEQRQLKEEVRKLKEQQMEPIRIDRLEIDRGGTHKRLDAVQENTNILKIQMEGARADILRGNESQADLRDRLIEHRQRLESIEQKQDAHTATLGNLLNFAESHDALLKNTATKQDITNMTTKEDISRTETRMDRMESAQTEQGNLLKMILAELRKSRGE